MAQYLGDAKDMEELKRQIAEQRRLEKKTIQLSKELLNIKDRPELDWQKVAEISPKMIDKIEKTDISLPPLEEHIPDEAVKAQGEELKAQDEGKKAEIISFPARPFFGDDRIARYEWHLKNGFHTREDLEFKEEFEQSMEYRMLMNFMKIENIKQAVASSQD
jgi:hypothetical protein